MFILSRSPFDRGRQSDVMFHAYAAKSKSRPAKFLQFSLRGFLLLVTLLAIGLWCWQRPFTEVVVINDDNKRASGYCSMGALVWDVDEWEFADWPCPPIDDPFLIYLERPLPPQEPTEFKDPFVDGPIEETTRRELVGYYRRETRVMRRSGWRTIVRDGPTVAYNKSGQKIIHETWRADRRHGPYKLWNSEGKLIAQGKFYDGNLHGKWTVWDAEGKKRTEQQFKHGQRVGLWIEYDQKGAKTKETKYAVGRRIKQAEHRYQWGRLHSVHVSTFGKYERVTSEVTRSADEKVVLKRIDYREGKPHGVFYACYPDGSKRFEFHWQDGQPIQKWRWWNTKGELTRVVSFEREPPRDGDGKPIEGFTSRFEHATPWIHKAFSQSPPMWFFDCPLKEVVEYWRERHDLPLHLHFRVLEANGFDCGRGFTLEGHDIPVQIGLLLLLADNELVCDYRYEQLVITTKDDARTWSDRTGVKQLRPPPDSLWGRALAARTRNLYEETLSIEMLEELNESYGVEIQLDPRLHDPARRHRELTIVDGSIPLRDKLWILFGLEHLTCQMVDDTLVVRPLDR